ncbi:MAG: restriction endonuclease subunit S [Vibrio toranzoniae]
MVPNSWEKSPVGKLCKSIVPGRNKPKVFDGDIPWVTTPEISGKYIPSSKQKNYISQSVAKECGAKIVPKGAVIIAAVGELGLTAIAKEEIIINQQLHAFVCPPNVKNEYLAYFLSAQKPYMDTVASKTTIPYMNKSNCESIPVLLPPLPEQRKIAKILSTWDKTITTTEKLIESSKQQKKALMQQLLTGKKRLVNPETGNVFEGEWEEVRLGDILTKISNGLTYDSKAAHGLPVSRIETISTGKVNHAKVGYAPDDEKTIKFKLEFGDILYSHINSLEHIGRVAYFLDDKDLYHGMNLLLLRSSRSVDSKFIYFMLLSSLGKAFARSHAKSAVNQASISTADLKGFKVKVPSLGEQQKIASVLTAADEDIEVLEAKLSHLKQEKKALMQQLLTGKKRVQVEESVAA